MSGLFSILWVVNAIYSLSMVLFIFNFVCSSGEGMKRLANQTLYLGFLVSSFYILGEAKRLGSYLPVTSLYQALFFFSWAIVSVYLLLAWQLKLDTFGLVLVPLIFVMSLTALFFYKKDVNPMPYKGDHWFVIHVVTAFFAYASFALSFVGALLYLVQNRVLKSKKVDTFYHKLPPLEVLETVVYRTIILGFPLLTLALLSGFIWTKQVFQVFWRWDPKFILSTLTWLIYLAILYAHYVFSFRGRKVVVISILAFGCVLLTFLGVNFFESSVHNFLK